MERGREKANFGTRVSSSFAVPDQTYRSVALVALQEIQTQTSTPTLTRVHCSIVNSWDIVVVRVSQQQCRRRTVKHTEFVLASVPMVWPTIPPRHDW